MADCEVKIDYVPGTLYPEIFLDNKYSKAYFKLVNHRLLYPAPDNYVEKHHIIPKSLNGADTGLNMVTLNVREHLFCHKILTKCMVNLYGYHKMCRAALFMFERFKMSHNTKYTAIMLSELKQIARELSIAQNQITNRNPEKIRKTAEKHRGRKRPESTRAKISEKLKQSIVDRGHGYSKNSKFYYSPSNPSEIKMCFTEDDIPDGWVLGNGKIKGLVLYFDPETKETRRFRPGQQPEGWEKGNPASKNASHYTHVETGRHARFVPGTEPEGWVRGHTKFKETPYFINPETGEYNRFAIGTEPDGWVRHSESTKPKPKPRRKSFYYNPTDLTEYTKCLVGTGPEGWITYREKEARQLKMYTNPDNLKQSGPYTPDTAPDGWIIVKSCKGSKKYFNKETGEAKRFKRTEEIPEGWVPWVWAFNSDQSKWKVT